MDILVLGIGNALLGDESVGVKAVEELGRRYVFAPAVELLDGGTAGMELLAYIRNRDVVLIIDAMRFDAPPGAIGRVEGADVPAAFRNRISPHQLGLSDLLAAAMLTDELPDRLVLFGVEPQSLEPGFALSPPVAASFEKLLAAVVEELRGLGVDARPRTGSETEPLPAATPWAYVQNNASGSPVGKEPA